VPKENRLESLMKPLSLVESKRFLFRQHPTVQLDFTRPHLTADKNLEQCMYTFLRNESVIRIYAHVN